MKTPVFIDRLIDNTAVLTNGTHIFELPRSLLPANAREGDVLNLSITLDLEASRKAREEVAEKLQELGEGDDGGDFSL